MRDGLIDEAYRMASAADLRGSPRGAAVLSSLADKFIARARENYRADRFTEALMDLDRAEAGGVMKAEIDELRGYVRMVAAEQERQSASRRDRIHEAQRRIERGSVAAAKDMLEQAAAADPAARAVVQQAEHHAREADRAVAQAERLLQMGQYAQAAERIRRAKRLDAHDESLARVESELVKTVLASVAEAIGHGKLSRAATELACLDSLGKKHPAVREAFDILDAAKQAGDAIRTHDYAAARQHVLVLNRKMPGVPWMQAAESHLKQLEGLSVDLTTGPLGDRIELKDMDGRPARPAAHAAPGARPLDETIAVPMTARPPAPVGSERFLLLVDGGGSYLVLRGGQASLGRAASDIPADVPIISDLAERHANITRVDDDYFLFSSKDVEIGGVATQHGLLRDGDRVVLGKKAKFTFRVPSRKSSTAVLELSDTTKAPNDVRRVVLLNNHAIVANSPTAHIFCRHAGCSLVLFERAGSLWIRAKGDGHVDTEAKPLILGQPVEIGGASLCMTAWKQPNATRTV